MSRYSIQELLRLSNDAQPYPYTERDIEQMQMHISLKISTPPPERKKPLAEHVAVAGNIVWLEPEHHRNSKIMPCILSHYHRCTGTIESGAFDHPAVILKTCDETGPNGETMVLCCTMSSNPRPNANHPHSLCISSSLEKEGPNPFFMPKLIYLESMPGNFKQSNILNSHVYAIPLTQLSPYNDEPGQEFSVRISQGSYANLMRSVGISQDEWIETRHLKAGKPTTSNAEKTNNICAANNAYNAYHAYDAYASYYQHYAYCADLYFRQQFQWSHPQQFWPTPGFA